MSLPRDRSPDSTLALLSEGYAFIGNRCRALSTDVFETRLMLTRAVCMMGEEAAQVFYEPGRFTRQGALPVSVLRLLQDRGSVATLDGTAHRDRKAMFMSMMGEASLARLAEAADRAWGAQIARWRGMRRVVLQEEAEQVMMRAACDWAGIPVEAPELARRTRQMTSMIGAAGAVGPRNWWATLRRSATEAWMRDLLRAMREGRPAPPPGSPAAMLAGSPLDAGIAAVEMLNLLRPTVAVAHFVVFAAHALHANPAWMTRLREEDGEALENFVQEVRRFYPFFPAVGGRVLRPFTWRAHAFGEQDWVLLDLHGTNHDPRSWTAPGRFHPDRFSGRAIGAHELIPQGGGDHATGHRCAGEWATLALMRGAVRMLARRVRYTVAPQDLGLDLTRFPATPRSGFVLEGVSLSG